MVKGRLCGHGFKAALVGGVAMGVLVLAGLSGCALVAPAPETPAATVPETEPVSAETPARTPTPLREPARTVSSDVATPDETEPPPSPRASPTTAAEESPEARAVTPTRTKVARQEPTPVRTPRVTASPRATEGAPVLVEVVARATDAKTSPEAGPPPATPEPGSPVGSATTYLNVRAGPGTGYAILGWLEAGQSVAITGMCPDGGWWQIYFPGAADERGWVSAGYITAQNTENVPVVGAPAAAPPPPAQVANWRGEYFEGRDLAGRPALARDDANVDFDWGAGSPAPGLPADNFSVRWTRDLNFSAGSYRFYAYVDDGVRLWIDGVLVIDQWRESTPTTHTADVALAEGAHTVVMEYFEATGNALAQLSWAPAQDYPDWKGEYFDNPGLNGAPVLVRNDVTLDFHWDGSPGPGVPEDNFSARWTRTLHFPGGTYAFTIIVDDGARLWVDDELLIDGWRSGAPDDFTGDIGLSDGQHTLRVEYFEFRYGAQIYLNWEALDEGADWEAEYFDNEKLKGDSVLERDDGLIKFNWGDGSPGPGVPADNFSARWRQDAEFWEGSYIFGVVVDDGVRLWVDGELVIDSWQVGGVRWLQGVRDLSHGTHRVKVEYFEHTGHAQIEVTWDRR